MSYYLRKGNSFDITNEANIDIRQELPVGTYSVMASMDRGLYLERQPDIIIDHKVYGEAPVRAERIINTFNDRKGTTGVILQGEKGSGKTMLAKLLSHRLRGQDVLTLLVNQPFCGESFNTFISSINQPCIIIFDEFEKVYDKDAQNKLLTLLDGTFSSKKLFVVTLNSIMLVNDFMKNRPGRFFYSFEYQGLEESFVREYCEDTLIDKSKIDSIVNFSSVFSRFNFDMLKAIVEEMNRYNEGLGDVLRHLNIKPNENLLQLEVSDFKSSNHDKDWKLDTKKVTINPINGVMLFLSKGNDDDEDSDSDYDEISFNGSDLKRMSNGRFVFDNGNASVVLQKVEPKPSAYDTFYSNL